MNSLHMLHMLEHVFLYRLYKNTVLYFSTDAFQNGIVTSATSAKWLKTARSQKRFCPESMLLLNKNAVILCHLMARVLQAKDYRQIKNGLVTESAFLWS